MFGNGETFYHPVYIDNLVDAFELAAEKDGIRGETYIIADEHYYTIEQLVHYVAEALGQGRQGNSFAVPATVACGLRVRNDMQTSAHHTASVPASRGLVPTSACISLSTKPGRNWAINPGLESKRAWAGPRNGTVRTDTCD